MSMADPKGLFLGRSAPIRVPLLLNRGLLNQRQNTLRMRSTVPRTS